MKGWFIFSVLLTIATIRSSIVFFTLFVNLSATFLMLAIANYNNGDVNWTKAGGYFGLVTAAFGWYIGVSLIYNEDNSWITLPMGRFPWAEKGTHCP